MPFVRQGPKGMLATQRRCSRCDRKVAPDGDAKWWQDVPGEGDVCNGCHDGVLKENVERRLLAKDPNFFRLPEYGVGLAAERWRRMMFMSRLCFLIGASAWRRLFIATWRHGVPHAWEFNSYEFSALTAYCRMEISDGSN